MWLAIPLPSFNRVTEQRVLLGEQSSSRCQGRTSKGLRTHRDDPVINGDDLSCWVPAEEDCAMRVRRVCGARLCIRLQERDLWAVRALLRWGWSSTFQRCYLEKQSSTGEIEMYFLGTTVGAEMKGGVPSAFLFPETDPVLAACLH